MNQKQNNLSLGFDGLVKNKVVFHATKEGAKRSVRNDLLDAFFEFIRFEDCSFIWVRVKKTMFFRSSFIAQR